MSISPGTRLGLYEILSPLGSGGMGDVYRARDTQLGRDVAVKVLPSISPDRLRRFELEARAASALNHPNILTIHAVGEQDGIPYLVSELVPGETLRQRLARSPLSLREAVEFTIQIGEALAAAHDAGLVHRDVKPANVMIRPDGYVKLLDFGLVKLLERPGDGDPEATREASSLTVAGTAVGTLNYMSPEQVRGTGEDARSDIFSLGIVLYEMVSGHRPFEGRSPADQIAALLERDPVPLSDSTASVPPDLDRIVARMLRKNREERYARTADLVRELKSLRQGLDLQEKPASMPLPGRKEPRRALLAFAFAASLLAALVFGWWGVRSWRSAHRSVSPEAERWYQVGVTALREGAYHQASGALDRAVRSDRTFVLALARLAEAWAELDQPDRAKDAMLEVSRLVPDRSSLPVREQTYIQAVSAIIVRDFAGAIAAYRKDLPLSGDAERAQINVDLGRAYEKSGDSEAALRCYLEAGRLDAQYAVPLLLSGVLHGRALDYDRALADFSAAENIFRLQGNVEGRAEVLYQRGTMYLRQTRLAEAKADFDAVREFASISGNDSQRVRAELQLSDLLMDQGFAAAAEKAAQDAICFASERGFEDLACRGNIKLGDRKFQQGLYEAAEAHYKLALEQAQRSKTRRNEALSLFMLGSLNISRRNLDAGLEFTNRALAFYRPGGFRQEVLLGLTLVARANRMKGNYAAARAALQEQMPLTEKSDSGADRIYLHYDFGHLLEQMGELPEALKHIEIGIDIGRKLKIQSEIGSGEVSRALILGKLGRAAESRVQFDQAAKSAVSDLSLKWDLLISQAEVELLYGHFDQASQLAGRAMDPSEDDPAARIESRRIKGLAHLRSGGIRKGQLLCEEALSLARNTHDAGLLATADLALAEARLVTGDASGAQARAFDLAGRFAESGQKELEWQANLLALRAAGRSGDKDAASEAAKRAQGILTEREKQWQSQVFSLYVTRPDVARARHEVLRILAQNH